MHTTVKQREVYHLWMAFVMVSLIVVLKWEQEKRGARIARIK
jgi:hypothetical protein